VFQFQPACSLKTHCCPLHKEVASHLCDISFKATETANEIFLNFVEKRDPGALLSQDDSGGGSDLQESNSANSTKRLREGFSPFSTQVQRIDTYLNFLLDNVSSKGPISLRRGQDHRTTIRAGDVVVYEESNAPAFKSWLRLERTTAGAALEGIFVGRVGWGKVGVGGV
jgi:hypothetical protein